MKWINSLLSNRKERKQLSRLVTIAQVENIIDGNEIHILSKNIGAVPSLNIKESTLEAYREDLPTTPKDRFLLVYYLVRTLMKNGSLSDKKENLINRLVSVMKVPTDKAGELTSYIKLNIRNGLSQEDSFSRLGYLLEAPRYN